MLEIQNGKKKIKLTEIYFQYSLSLFLFLSHLSSLLFFSQEYKKNTIRLVNKVDKQADFNFNLYLTCFWWQ